MAEAHKLFMSGIGMYLVILVYLWGEKDKTNVGLEAL